MNDKERVATYAATLVENGMTVGLGTGSTADLFIEALAVRCKEENLQIQTVSSSVVSMIKAQQSGLQVISIEQLSRLDLYVDGADEVAPDNTLLKGQGSDLVREKLLAKAADQFIVMVDQSKLVEYIGEKFAVPIEVIPFAWQLVKQSLKAFNATGELRRQGGGLAVTSHGSLVLDMTFDQVGSEQLNSILNRIPGIVEHGVFYQLADAVCIAQEGVVQIR